jgi:hypothetical protein
MKIKNWLPSKRDIKYFWQRRTRGWDDSQCWSLDYSLAKLIAPRLKRFKEVTVSFPHGLSCQEWNDILDQMIASFEYFGSEERWDSTDDESIKHQEGVDLFAKWYNHLWS